LDKKLCAAPLIGRLFVANTEHRCINSDQLTPAKLGRQLMKIISLAALLCASLSAQAALWSSTNASVRAGAFTTSMLISLSGDQRAVDGQVDITIPFGVSVTVTSV
jgi:hypothetical protein